MKNMFKHLLPTLLLLALLASLAGCGGADSGAETDKAGTTAVGTTAEAETSGKEEIGFTDTAKRFYCKPENSMAVYKGDDYQIYVTSIEIEKSSERGQVQIAVGAFYRNASKEGKSYDIRYSYASVNGVQTAYNPYMMRWITVSESYKSGDETYFIYPWDFSLFEKCVDIELTFDVRDSESQQLINTINWHYNPYGDEAAAEWKDDVQELAAGGKTLIDTDVLKVVSLGFADPTAFSGYASKLMIINKTSSEICLSLDWNGGSVSGDSDTFPIGEGNVRFFSCAFAAGAYEDLQNEQLTFHAEAKDSSSEDAKTLEDKAVTFAAKDLK